MRIVKLGTVNFWRHRWLTLGATLLMTLTLTMITVFLILTFLANDTAKAIRDKIDLAIYFRDDAVTDDQIISFSQEIEAIPEVTEINFVSKEMALEIFGRLPLNEKIKAPITQENNPLPRSLEIKTTNPNNLDSTIDTIIKTDDQNLICSDCVSYSKNRENVQKISLITRLVQKAGLMLSIFFILIAIFNVYNIIRISIRARSDEIEIMRFVGASTGFVQGPFIVEGALFGVIATIFTTIFILIIAKLSSPYIDGTFAVLDLNLFKYVSTKIVLLVIIQLMIGVLIGMMVSLISVRKYLKI